MLEAQQEIAESVWDGYLGPDWEEYYHSEEWWAPTMPPRAFLREGLVHMSSRWDGTTSYCGAEAIPYGVRLYSTDAARDYAKMLETLASEVNCLTCLVYEGGFCDRFSW